MSCRYLVPECQIFVFLAVRTPSRSVAAMGWAVANIEEGIFSQRERGKGEEKIKFTCYLSSALISFAPANMLAF